MASLATLPTDILEQIAIHTSTPSLADLLHLMMSCRRVHLSLCVANNPHVYASISRELFDIPVIRQGLPPDSALAAELIQRLRLFRRIRRGDLSTQTLAEDLWTAYGLVLEAGPRNASQLAAAKFSGYIEDAVRKLCSPTEGEGREELRDLAIWLLVLTITKDEIGQMREEARVGLLDVLRPIVMRGTAPSGRNEHVFSDTTPPSTAPIIFYGVKQEHHPGCCPPVVSAAITLCFALRQVHPLEDPLTLPADRATAVAEHRSGPTHQDFLAMAAFRTPLFVDTAGSTLGTTQYCTQIGTASSAPFHGERYLDPILYQLPIPGMRRPSVYGYIQQHLPGIWEGMHLFAPCDLEDQDFIAQVPMQVVLSVHFSFSPSLPVSGGHMNDEDPQKWAVNHLSLGGGVSKHQDHATTIPSNSLPVPSSKYDDWRHPDHALECVISGQTLPDHDEAWGAYRFYGRVYRDGRIVLRREPKSSWDTGDSASHIFEGYLHYGRSWVGTWRVCHTLGRPGIFSMRKRHLPQKHED